MFIFRSLVQKENKASIYVLANFDVKTHTQHDLFFVCVRALVQDGFEEFYNFTHPHHTPLNVVPPPLTPVSLCPSPFSSSHNVFFARKGELSL